VIIRVGRRFFAEFVLSGGRFFALPRPVVSEANLMTVEPPMMTWSEGFRITAGPGITLSVEGSICSLGRALCTVSGGASNDA